MTPSPLKYVTDNTYQLRQDDRIVGFYLYDKYDEMLSRIQGLLVEPESYTARYIVFTDGGFLFTSGKTILVPKSKYELVDMGKVIVSMSREALQGAPLPEDIQTLTLEEEEKILGYFDLPVYWPQPSEDENN